MICELSLHSNILLNDTEKTLIYDVIDEKPGVDTLMMKQFYKG